MIFEPWPEIEFCIYLSSVYRKFLVVFVSRSIFGWKTILKVDVLLSQNVIYVDAQGVWKFRILGHRGTPPIKPGYGAAWGFQQLWSLFANLIIYIYIYTCTYASRFRWCFCTSGILLLLLFLYTAYCVSFRMRITRWAMLMNRENKNNESELVLSTMYFIIIQYICCSYPWNLTMHRERRGV